MLAAVTNDDSALVGEPREVAAQCLRGVGGNPDLEVLLHANLRPYGWTCCWGNCMQGIDFCSLSGDLLHIRNKSNTEVSSNDRNRIKNKVKKWFRMNAYTGKTKWDELNLIVGKPGLFSEEGFSSFVLDTAKSNPDCLYTGAEDSALLSALIERFDSK